MNTNQVSAPKGAGARETQAPDMEEIYNALWDLLENLGFSVEPEDEGCAENERGKECWNSFKATNGKVTIYVALIENVWDKSKRIEITIKEAEE